MLEGEDGWDGEVMLLLPTEEPRGKRGEVWSCVMQGWKVRRRVWIRGWEVYAIDGWVLERSRRGKCVLSGGEGAQRATGEARSREQGEGRGEGMGVLVDEVVPVPGNEGWRDQLMAFREKIEADGGELVEISGPATATATNGTQRTRTFLPVTPLQHLAHGLHPIHIPEGNYEQVKERLWVNLNLRRLGCSGRSSVGLAAPR